MRRQARATRRRGCSSSWAAPCRCTRSARAAASLRARGGDASA
jgi:hypothetical protein